MQGNAQLQGNVSLMDCTITKEDFSFSVRAPHMKVYSFLVQTKQDVEQWAAALVAAIKQARELEETAASKPNNVDIVNSVRILTFFFFLYACLAIFSLTCTVHSFHSRRRSAA